MQFYIYWKMVVNGVLWGKIYMRFIRMQTNELKITYLEKYSYIYKWE